MVDIWPVYSGRYLTYISRTITVADIWPMYLGQLQWQDIWPMYLGQSQWQIFGLYI